MMSDSPPPVLITDRLVGRPPRPGDFLNLHGVFSNPVAARWLSAEGLPLPPEKTRRILDLMTDHWMVHDFGPWMFETPAGAFAGYAGLRLVILEGRAETEILYALNPDAWGQGLCSEMAAAVVAHGRDQLALTDIIGFAMVENAASRRIMEKTGFAFEHNFPRIGRPHALYRWTPPA